MRGRPVPLHQPGETPFVTAQPELHLAPIWRYLRFARAV